MSWSFYMFDAHKDQIVAKSRNEKSKIAEIKRGSGFHQQWLAYRYTTLQHLEIMLIQYNFHGESYIL